MTVPASKIGIWIDQLRNRIGEDNFTVLRILNEIKTAIQNPRCDDLASCYTAKGIALATLGRQEESLDAHRNACRLAPSVHTHPFNMGVTLNVFGMHAEAYKAYVTALELPGGYDVLVLGSLAATLMELGEPAEARSAMLESLRLSASAPYAVLRDIAWQTAYVGLNAEAVELLARYVRGVQNQPRGTSSSLEVLDNAKEIVAPLLAKTEFLAHAVEQVRAWGGKFPNLVTSIADLPRVSPATTAGDEAQDAVFAATSALRGRANAVEMEEHLHG